MLDVLRVPLMVILRITRRLTKSVHVMAKGGREDWELIAPAALKSSVSKVAYAYAEKHVGPREKVGNKGGTLGNRLRAVMAEKR